MKKSIKKTNLLVALLATTLFSTVATATVPKTALIKAESLNQTHMIQAAHSSLKATLAPIKITYSQLSANNEVGKQNQAASQNKSVTVAKTRLIAE